MSIRSGRISPYILRERSEKAIPTLIFFSVCIPYPGIPSIVLDFSRFFFLFIILIFSGKRSTEIYIFFFTYVVFSEIFFYIYFSLTFFLSSFFLKAPTFLGPRPILAHKLYREWFVAQNEMKKGVWRGKTGFFFIYKGGGAV